MDIDSIRQGMTVYSEDGKKLGKIIRRDDEDLVIEKGLLSRKDYVASLDDVARIEGDRVWLRQTAEEIERGPDEEDEEPGRAAAKDPAEMSAASDDEVILIEEEVVVIGPADEEEEGRGALRGPGRTPNGRR